MKIRKILATILTFVMLFNTGVFSYVSADKENSAQREKEQVHFEYGQGSLSEIFDRLEMSKIISKDQNEQIKKQIKKHDFTMKLSAALKILVMDSLITGVLFSYAGKGFKHIINFLKGLKFGAECAFFETLPFFLINRKNIVWKENV